MPDGRDADILIAGGGSAGLIAALAIARSAPGLAIEIVDAKPRPAAGQRDERASAIAAAARRMLEQPRRLGGGRRRRRSRSSPWRSPTAAPAMRAADLPHLRRRGRRRASRSRTWCRTSRCSPRSARRRARRGSRSRRRMRWSASRPTGMSRSGLRRARTRRAKLLVAADGVRSRLRALRRHQDGDAGAIRRRRSSRRSGTSARTTASRWSISCRAGRSPSCR